MKYIYTLIAVFILSSCTGAKQTVNNPVKKEKITEHVKHKDTVKISKNIITEPKISFPKENNSIEINLAEDDTVDENGLSKTFEIIADESFNHENFNKLLKKYVTIKGNVDYKGFKNEKKQLHNYITLLGKFMPTENWSKNDKLAYWINAYNALTIDLIIKNYPIKSIKDIKDPWEQRLWKLGSKWYNLNEIEHQILRKMNEPRIHFGIVCASYSCPKLSNKAYTASDLDVQLTRATKDFLKDSERNNISENSINLSKIFKWFAKDFKTTGSLIDFLNKYSDITISKNAKKSYKDYNWSLNE